MDLMSLWLIENQRLVTKKKKIIIIKKKPNNNNNIELYTRAHDTVMRHWSVIFFFDSCHYWTSRECPISSETLPLYALGLVGVTFHICYYKQGFWYFARSRTREIPRNSPKNAKYREIRKKYFQILVGKTYLILILAIRPVLFTPNVQIYLETSSLQRVNNVPKLPGVLD